MKQNTATAAAAQNAAAAQGTKNAAQAQNAAAADVKNATAATDAAAVPVMNTAAAAAQPQPKNAAEADKIASALERRADAAEKRAADAAAKLEKAKADKAAARSLRAEIGLLWQKAKKNGDKAEMKLQEKRNNSAQNAEKRTAAAVSSWTNKKRTAEADAKKLRAEAKAARRLANKMSKVDADAQAKKNAAEAQESARLQKDVNAATAAHSTAATDAKAKRTAAKDAAAEAAEAEAQERRRRIDLAAARFATGTATAEDAAILAENAANMNAAAVWEAAANAFASLRKEDAYKTAWNAFHSEAVSLSKACKDAVKIWRLVAPVLNAAAVGVAAADISPKLFAAEAVSPFLCVATASGIKVGILGRSRINAVNAWNVEKLVTLLVMNAVICRICKADAKAAAAAEAQKDLLIDAAAKLAAAAEAAANSRKASANAAAAQRSAAAAKNIDALAQAQDKAKAAAAVAATAKNAATAAKNAAKNATAAAAKNKAATAAQRTAKKEAAAA